MKIPTLPQNLNEGGGLAFDENGTATDAQSGSQGAGNQFYRIMRPNDSVHNGRTISFGGIGSTSWESLSIQARIRATQDDGDNLGEGKRYCRIQPHPT